MTKKYIYSVWSLFVLLQPKFESSFLSSSSYHYNGKSASWASKNDLIISDCEELIIVPESGIAKDQVFDSSANIFDYYHHSHSNNAAYSMEYNVRYRQSFVIGNLRPASTYEARVEARNRHGWSKLSNVLNFSTRAQDGEWFSCLSVFFIKILVHFRRQLKSWSRL